MTLCSEAIAVNANATAGKAVTIYCRSWSCEICNPRRLAELKRLGKAGNPTSFITLTCNPAYSKNPAVRALDLSIAWKEIRKRACKLYGYTSIPFLAVFEATKNGEPHLHILARCEWISQRWLSEQMKDLINAPIVYITRVKSKKHVSSYVAKYVGKGPTKYDYTKRYWTSKDWAAVQDEGEETVDYSLYGWQIQKITIQDQQAIWSDMGWHTELRGGVLYGEARDPPD